MVCRSITRASIKEARKAPNIGKFDTYETQFGILRDFGFQTWAAFTLGYDHDTPDAFSGQDYFPEAMGRQRFYDPPERGFERDIRKRLEYWDKLRRERGGAK